MAIDGYWGLCPICKKTHGYVNIGRNHWSICEKHRTRWWIGSNCSHLGVTKPNRNSCATVKKLDSMPSGTLDPFTRRLKVFNA